MLELYWTDVNNNKYHLGNLYKNNKIYKFEIIENDLKKAVQCGCFGIGTIDITKNSQESSELFDFFKNRIPKQDELSAEELMKYYRLDRYDEMEMLKITEGRLMKDRYYLQYVEN